VSVPDEAGTYSVDFNRAIDDSAYVATLGLPGDASIEDPGSVTVVRTADASDSVYIATSDVAGNIEPRGFHLAVHC
jgi:hypothetical protein